MPTFNVQNLLSSLESDIQVLLKEVESIQGFSERTLIMHPHAGRWSIAQIIEHLNSYNRFYLPAIEAELVKIDQKNAEIDRINAQITESNTTAKRKKRLKNKVMTHNPVFSTGIFGAYFTNRMMPKENGKITKMSAPRDYSPNRILDGHKVLSEFIAGQQKMIDLLHKAQATDIQKIRIPITLTSLIKFRLGDTFRFVVAHQQRHFLQLKTAITQVRATETIMRMVA